MTPITIGENTCVGNDVFLLTGSHDITSNTFDLVIKPISIGDGCWISTRAIVLQGYSIGDYSVVATNSTVTNDVDERTVVGGTPARFLKRRIIEYA